jgi:hypothetical protein
LSFCSTCCSKSASVTATAFDIDCAPLAGLPGSAPRIRIQRRRLSSPAH